MITNLVRVLLPDLAKRFSLLGYNLQMERDQIIQKMFCCIEEVIYL